MTDTFESAIYADVHGEALEARSAWGTGTRTSVAIAGASYSTSASAGGTNDHVMLRSDKRWWRRTRSSGRTGLRRGWSSSGWMSR